MSETENAVHAEELQLVAALGEYMDRLDKGEQLDRAQFIAQYPTIADALRAHFENSDFVEDLAGPTVADELQNTAAADTSLAMAIQDTKATPPAGTDDSKYALPNVFGRYRVEQTLGEGAMGAVYLAEDTELKRKVALKVPKFNSNDEPEIIERFYREAQSVARLHHRNICPVFDIGEIDGVRFISMAYVDGKPLSAFIHAEKSLPEKQAVLVVRKLALALKEAHEHNIIHRDLKPSNIMIDKQSEPVILDFGLARSLTNPEDSRLTRDGMIVGTPAYMSPEQIRADGNQIGPATDIYCLGVVMYELLTGQLPFTGSMTEVLALALHEPAPQLSSIRPQIDSRLDSLCLSMMSKNIDERPASMLDVADSLSLILKSPDGSQQPSASSVAKDSSTPPVPASSPSTDSGDFDPYHKWLGIPSREQPPNHYRLLAIDLFESDLDVIDSAAMGRMTHLRQFSNGPHAVVSQTLLNEISNAQICLLNPEKKSVYDAHLKSEHDAKVETVEATKDEPPRQNEKVSDPKLNQKIQKLDKQKMQIEALIEKCEFAAAISALEKMAAVKSPKLAKYAKWAKLQIPKTRRGTKEMRESGAAVYRTATELFDRYDYEEAAEMLQQIPSKYRNAEFSELLQECLDLQEEIVSLQEDIDHAESINKYDELQPTVERLLEIKPNDRRAKKLLKELKTYGKGGGMRLGGRGDRRFDAAGNSSNPVKVALFVAIPLALFAAVSWATVIYIRSNNKTIKIEIDDPSVKVLIDEEEVVITGAGDTIKLNVGMHDLVVERGDTKVITRQFEVVKGKNPVLRITLADATVASQQNPNAPGRQPPSKDDTSLAELMKQIPGLVAYYPLDEKSGAVAKDASGNGHFGKIQGNVKFTSGKVGNAMKFDKEALVDLGKPIDVSRSTPFSIGAWIQPNETGRMSIVSRHPSTRELPGHGLLLARGGTLYGRLSHVWGKNAIQVATKEPLDLKKWHHVLMTYDGSSKAAGLNLFVDGKQQPVNILMDSLTGSIATDSPITISRNVNDLPAGIDEVAIFNRVLRADEVAQIVRWASDTTKTIPPASSGGAGGAAVVVCDMLQSKRAPTGLNAQAVAFSAPNGDGRRGANGVLIDAPAGWETQGTAWSCDFSRDGAARGVIFIHPHQGGQVMVTVSAGGLHVGSPGEWPNDRNASLYSPRYKGFALKTADDFKQVFQLGDQSHQLTSRLAADGSFEFLLDGKVVATTQVTSASLLQFTDMIKVAKPPKKGTSAVIIGPTDRGSARASNVRLSTIVDTGTSTNNLPTAAANRRAAEWVLSVGGSLHFSSADTQGIHNKINRREDIPQGAFDITVVRLGGKQFSDDDLQNLRGLSKLFQLELNSTKIDGTGLGHLIDLPALTSLRISSTSFSDEGISQLAKLSRMIFLDANDVRFSDVALLHLSAHPNLKTIYLAGANATDGCAAYLKRIPNLGNLNFQNAPITDATLVHLAEMKKLTQINLQNTKITDAGLTHLAKSESVTSLDIRRTKITDTGLMHLVSMSKLDRLMLEGTAVTAEGVAKYQAARKAAGSADVNVTR